MRDPGRKLWRSKKGAPYGTPGSIPIGHAEVSSELLNTPIPVNRIDYIQQPGERAIVFKLKSRVPAGTILSKQQIEEIAYEFGLLTRTK